MLQETVSTIEVAPETRRWIWRLFFLLIRDLRQIRPLLPRTCDAFDQLNTVTSLWTKNNESCRLIVQEIPVDMKAFCTLVLFVVT